MSKKRILLLPVILISSGIFLVSCTNSPGNSAGNSTSATSVSTGSSAGTSSFSSESSRTNGSSAGSLSSGSSAASSSGANIIYVAKSGDDNNSGTKTKPVKTIQEAIVKAVASGITCIYVAAGVYKNGDGLLDDGKNGIIITNDNLQLIGGWDGSFTSQTGYSELDGNGSMLHVVYAGSVKNILLNGFVIRGGDAEGVDMTGGGIKFEMVSSSILTNLIISNNTSYQFGGGVYFYYKCNNNVVSCLIYANNSIQDYCGGMYLYKCYNNTIDCIIVSNTGGGIELDTSTNNTIKGRVEFNRYSVFSQTSGVYLLGSHNNTINSEIRHNSNRNIGVGGEAGGIYLTNSFSNSILGFVEANSSNGIFIDTGEYNLINAQISYNIGRGIFLNNASNNTISGTISYNSNSSDGGGIRITGASTGNLINGIINANIASKGAGISSDGNLLNTISANIINNTGSDYYDPVLYFVQANYTRIIGSVITNNRSSSGNSYNVITFYCIGGNSDNIVLSNNIIGGCTGSRATAVSLGDNNPVNNYFKTFMENIFITNGLSNLCDFMYGGSTNDINALNATNYVKAEFVGGNIVQ